MSELSVTREESSYQSKSDCNTFEAVRPPLSAYFDEEKTRIETEMGKLALAAATEKKENLELVSSAHSYNPSKEDEYYLNEQSEQDRYEEPYFTLLEQIGIGGFGEVWKAKLDTGETVAVKFYKNKEKLDEELNLSKLKELDHDNLTRILYTGENSARGRYVVREYVDGKSLQQIIEKEGVLPFEKCVRIAEQATKAVAYLHENNIVHGNLTPDNILVPDNPEESVKVCDFGLARYVKQGVEQSMRTTSIIEGTLDYMAPEQLYDRKKPTEESDVYSLGKLIIKALSGKLVHFPTHGTVIASWPVRIYDSRDLIKTLEINCLHPDTNARYSSHSIAETITEVLTRIDSERVYDLIKPHLFELMKKKQKKMFEKDRTDNTPKSFLRRIGEYALKFIPGSLLVDAARTKTMDYELIKFAVACETASFGMCGPTAFVSTSNVINGHLTLGTLGLIAAFILRNHLVISPYSKHKNHELEIAEKNREIYKSRGFKVDY